MCLTVGHMILIWSYRFLPLYDYPIWLYEVHIMRSLSDPVFAQVFQLSWLPIPNLGLVIPIWLLSFIFAIEVAGKIFLSIAVAALPWSFLYCVRAVTSLRGSWAELFCCPFAFPIYFFGGQAFLLGLSLLFTTIGFFLPKLERQESRSWFLLAAVLLVLYFVHALIFVLAALVISGSIIVTGNRLRLMRRIVLASLPTLLCAIIYARAYSSPESTELLWTPWILASNVFKSFFVFIKSNGHTNPLPLTLMNVSVLGILVVIVLKSGIQAKEESLFDKRFLPAIVVSLVLMISLPGIFLGVFQPGVRFALPTFLFIAIMIARAKSFTTARTMLLFLTTTVLIYNFWHFERLNAQMSEVYGDLNSTVSSREPYCVVRFDWPSDRTTWDIGASSVDPLFGAINYVQLERSGVGAIFGTSLLSFREGFRRYKPLFAGRTREEYTDALIREKDRLSCFRYLILLGKNEDIDRFTVAMVESGFRALKTKPFWVILEKKGDLRHD